MKQKMTHNNTYSKKFIIAIMALSFLFSACQEEPSGGSVKSSKPAESMEELEIPDNFNFETTSEVQINLTLQATDGSPLNQVKVGVYDDKKENGGNLVASGITDASGQLSMAVSLPSYMDSVSIRPNYIGLISEAYVPLKGGVVDLTIGGPNESVLETTSMATQANMSTKVISYWDEWFHKLGDWDKKGVPNYLEKKRDHIKKDFLYDLNASLPEAKPVPTYNPDYLEGNKDMNTRLQEKAEVWLTFVHEGAGWLNSLGYYKYDLNNPPETVDDIDSLFMVFPNASYNNDGGGLKSGDKVSLGVFEAGTGIGWFLVPDGWNPWFISVIKSNSIKWSDKRFNTFTDEANAQHMVALKDEKRELILLGFEDTSRPAGDNDFNDCVFYVSANPFTAVITDEIRTIKTTTDSDKDGVDDNSDEYPDDPERAYNRYSPAKDVFGTVAYEDLWPSKGDYDFNDLVVDYNHQLVMNAQNKVVEMKSTFKTRAIGGAYKNGFGFQLNVTPDKIQSVEGTELTDGYIKTNANGTEAGQKKAVIMVYDNAFAHMSPVSGYTVNAEKGSRFVEPFVSNITVTFVSPQSESSLGSSPYNPFVMSNKRRGVEIHLPNFEPTDLCDQTLFSTEDDATNHMMEHYFKTKRNHPWAIHLPEKFDYPSEQSDIVNAYYYFEFWAESGGMAYPDWYKNSGIYRNNDYIY